MKVSPLVIGIILSQVAMGTIGFMMGQHSGEVKGVKLAHAENDIRVSEHDRIMQRVGVCKWAQIMQEDIRCKHELP